VNDEEARRDLHSAREGIDRDSTVGDYPAPAAAAELSYTVYLGHAVPNIVSSPANEIA